MAHMRQDGDINEQIICLYTCLAGEGDMHSHAWTDTHISNESVGAASFDGLSV